jgi:hypothetical protein
MVRNKSEKEKNEKMAGEFKENCQYWYFVQKIGANFKSFNFPNLHVNSCAEINCAKTSCVLNLVINGFAAQYLKFWHEALLRAFSFALLSHFWEILVDEKVIYFSIALLNHKRIQTKKVSLLSKNSFKFILWK